MEQLCDKVNTWGSYHPAQMDDVGEFETIKRSYREFFEHDRLEGRYINKLRDAVEQGKYRLIVNLNDLRTMRVLDDGCVFIRCLTLFVRA